MNNLKWQKIKNKEFPKIESMLRDVEQDYVSACSRFINRVSGRDQVWALRRDDGSLAAITFIYRNMLFPVLCGLPAVPHLKFMGGLFGLKKLHHVMGLKNEVLILQNELKKFNLTASDIYDYDLMSLDYLPAPEIFSRCKENPIIRKAELSDLEQIVPLQKGYEEEEIYHVGWTFHPAASRVNLVNLIAAGNLYVAELGGSIVGKINISAISFTRYQIGGVYVAPALRGRGIARCMTGVFVTSLINQNRGITLFVKKNNPAAQKLYRSLGFKVRGDFRISYY